MASVEATLRAVEGVAQVLVHLPSLSAQVLALCPLAPLLRALDAAGFAATLLRRGSEAPAEVGPLSSPSAPASPRPALPQGAVRPF